MTNNQGIHHSHIKIWMRLIVRMTLFAIALMWPAGILNWWEAWVIIAIWSVFGVIMTYYLLQNDPELLA